MKNLAELNLSSGVYVLTEATSQSAIQDIVLNLGYAFFYLDGSKFSSGKGMASEIKHILGVPQNLGGNWDALYDILTGFEWKSSDAAGYIMLFENFEKFSTDEEREFCVGLSTLQAAAHDAAHNRNFIVLLRGNANLLPSEFRNLESIHFESNSEEHSA